MSSIVGRVRDAAKRLGSKATVWSQKIKSSTTREPVLLPPPTMPSVKTHHRELRGGEVLRPMPNKAVNKTSADTPPPPQAADATQPPAPTASNRVPEVPSSDQPGITQRGIGDVITDAAKSRFESKHPLLAGAVRLAQAKQQQNSHTLPPPTGQPLPPEQLPPSPTEPMLTPPPPQMPPPPTAADRLADDPYVLVA